MYQNYFVCPCNKGITATYAIYNTDHTGLAFNDIYKFRCIKDILTLVKFTFNKYRPLTAMCRISLQRPCRKSITATYTIFNREHALVTSVNIREFRHNRRILTEVIVRTDRQTNRSHKHFSTFVGKC